MRKGRIDVINRGGEGRKIRKVRMDGCDKKKKEVREEK